ncbi:MAG: peptidoglycan DD-metalloendopeptidase family protein [Alphaproteobacteria bacterium]|nr:peptidoglycan DD-metalloendopeptidase family protein [Alphaproteobacteria bacterium]
MDFKRAKSKAKKIRRQRTLLMVYGVAVTIALFVSLYHNNNVKASVDSENFVDEAAEDIALVDDSLVLEENLKQPKESDIIQEIAVENETPEIRNAEDMVTMPTKALSEDLIIVAQGDNFMGILTKLGVDYGQANTIYNAYKKVYDARKIKIGQEILISSLSDPRYQDMVSVTKIVTEPVSGTRYIVEKNSDGKYEARVEQDDLKNDVKKVAGVINGTVMGSMKNAGVPQSVVGNFINIFSFSVDFRRDIKAGDKFEVRYERKLSPNGDVVKTGDIIYAALTLGKRQMVLYRFKDNSGTVDYYDEKGLALKKTLDLKPMEFKKARISSKFGRRFHPILKQYRMHSGVDYAAPMNTKVYASGDGVVTSAKWVGGYGNYITIRHNSEYSTGYGHLKSYAKGIRPGVRVKQGQLIAYVGSTGRSTGPHLHFEVIKNGQRVDPLKIKAATGENLTGAKLKAFQKVVAEIKAGDAKEQKVAEAR